MNLGKMRRRMNVGEKQPINPYITDGLIMWLDGINRGTSEADKWVDLIDGREFEGENVTFGSNHLVCPNELKCYNPILFENNTTTGTMECVFCITKKENKRVYSNAAIGTTRTAKFPALGLYNNNYLLSNTLIPKISVPLTAMPISDSTIYRIAVKLDGTVIINGQRVTSAAADYYFATNGYAFVGAHTGKIFSIRLYNRNLTDDEILQNQQADMIRFNL